MDSSLIQQSSHGIMDEAVVEEDDLFSVSSSSDVSTADSMEDITSSASSSSPDQLSGGPLYEMSSLIQHLPFKRGLSKHYQGRSQSFTSLANVRCLEDLAKPENPCKKKLKTSKSYGGLSDHSQRSHIPKTFSRTISKKASRGSCSSLNAKRNNSFLGMNRPPIPPNRPSTLSNQPALFA